MRRMFGRTMPMAPSLFLSEADKHALRVVGSAPHAFAARRSGDPPGGYAPNRGQTKPPITSSDGRWKLGDRVFHDDQGYGAVTEIRESDEGPVIKAQFETGKEVRFLSRHQSSKYTKIGKDD
jgi:DNA helicase-2/ATP-dependent DNA helicase PcrA